MNYQKALRGLLIALGGAFLTYVAEQLPGVNFGAYTALVVASASALINLGREYLKAYSVDK